MAALANHVEVLAIFVATVAALIDARTGRIPNWLTLPTLCLGPVVHAVGAGRVAALDSVVGLLVAGVVPWLFYRGTRGRAIGGGDVKLFAALGALLGPQRGLQVQLTAFCVLALVALVVLSYRGQLSRVLRTTLRLAVAPLLARDRRLSPEDPSLTEFRMGPSIAAAVLTHCALAHLQRFAPWLG
jgi:prepilin peptidase CpaA